MIIVIIFISQKINPQNFTIKCFQWKYMSIKLYSLQYDFISFALVIYFRDQLYLTYISQKNDIKQ